MCGIAGLVDKEGDIKDILSRIKYRGLDDEGYYEDENVKFGHCLHSVVGNKKQPLEKDNFVFGANCEIYNWEGLKKKHKLKSENDAELLFDLLRLKGMKILDEFDGVFAFFLYDKIDKSLILARDILGEKPLWFNFDKGLSFASEKKALVEAEELNPRNILIYKNKKLEFVKRKFFNIRNNNFDKEKIRTLLEKAVLKRVPEKKLGLLFSGGLDSSLLAKILKRNNKDFIGYLSVDENKKEEIENAKKLAKEIGFELRIIKLSKEIVENKLKDIVNLIESVDPIKVEVATTLFFALEEAKKDNVKVIFSGVGADDIFIGYKRMLMDENLNEDSLSNLRRLYERDLYRDDVISMWHNIELRLPYLDQELVKEVLMINSKEKIGDEVKSLLRKIAKDFGLKNEFKRNAAQYSSGVSKLISKITKNKGKYLFNLYKKKNLKIGALLSGGKDSAYALHIMNRLNYDVNCLITIKSLNKDSFMFHTPTIELTKKQAECLELPLIFYESKGEKEKELRDLRNALLEARKKYKIQGIVSGALFSNYQRKRIEEVCDELNLKVYSPLWHMDQETLLRNLVKEKFEVIITAIAAEGFDENLLGSKIDLEVIEKLVKLNKKYMINVAGEGGEYESLVLDAPLFKKKIKILEAEKKMESENSGRLNVKRVELITK